MPEKRPTASNAKSEERERQPSHKVYSVEDREGGDPFWTRIGSAFPHKDGKGLNIILSAMPLNNRIVLRAVEPQAAEEQETPPARKR